jgi:hypothetical protein
MFGSRLPAVGTGTEEYYKYMKRLPEVETTIHPKDSAGVAVSYRKKTNRNSIDWEMRN